MKAFFASVLAFTCLASSPTASAQSVGTPAISNTAGQRGNMDQLICKRQSDTGTRFKRKICGTRAQWDKYREYQLEVASELLGKHGWQPFGG